MALLRLWTIFLSLTLFCAAYITFQLGAFHMQCSYKSRAVKGHWQQSADIQADDFTYKPGASTNQWKTAPKLWPAKFDSPNICTPQDHVLFLKTHKTGSSTIANILFRYGDARNLTFLLPHATFFEWPRRFNAFAAFPTYGEPPNILCSHARFNRAPMHWFFPKNRARYITILREPVHHFESVFDFMGFSKVLKLQDEPDSLATFLRKHKSFQLGLKASQKHELNLIRNPLLFDLGLHLKAFQNASAVKEYIKFLEEEFDLVMITEYFDESLILLKRLFCWRIEDVLFFKMNERRGKSDATTLGEDVKFNIKQWNAADVLLYSYFNKTFWKKVAAEGPDFYSDLENLRNRKREMERRCLSSEVRTVKTYGTKVVKGHSLRANLPEDIRGICERMTWTENFYLKYLRDKLIRKHAGIATRDVGENSEKLPEDWYAANDLNYRPVVSKSDP